MCTKIYVYLHVCKHTFLSQSVHTYLMHMTHTHIMYVSRLREKMKIMWGLEDCQDVESGYHCNEMTDDGFYWPVFSYLQVLFWKNFFE